MRARFMAVALAATAAAAGCGREEFDDPAGAIEVSRGDEFAITFGIRGGEGYDWRLAAPPPPIVELEEVDTDVPVERSAPHAGERRFEFKAVDSGRASLRFVRLDRGDTASRRTVTVDVD